MVVPEFDKPGHATAVCRSYPEISGGGEGKWQHFTFHPCKEETFEFISNVLDEIVARFGAPPKGVMNLIAIALLRARAAAAGITEITQKDGAILLSLATMDFAAISACCAEAQFKGRIFFSAGKVPMLSVKLKKGEDALKLATQLVGTYAAMRAQTAEG